MSSSYFLYSFILEKCGIFLKNSRFSGRIWPDWGNTAWADMAGIGVYRVKVRGVNGECIGQSRNDIYFSGA